MFFNKMRKVPGAALGLLLAVCLTGCGGGSAKTEEAMELVKNLDYAEALEVFDEAEAAGENERLIARGRGIACMGLTEYLQAIEYFKAALVASNGLVEAVDFDLNYYLAAAYIKSSRFEEAVGTYDAILALRPEEKDAYFLRGCARLELAEYEGAKADFDKVISMEPNNYERLIEIYEVLAHHGYKELGQEYLTNALESGAKQMDTYQSGRIYYYLGEYQKAYIALEEAKGKGDAESYLYLGRAYEATGDYNYAASVYSSYLTKEGPNAEVYNQLGLCEMTKGEYQKALEAFQAGMQIEDSGYLQTLSFNEIVAYEYLGEYQKAAVLLQNYLKTYPDDEKAKREMDFLSSR